MSSTTHIQDAILAIITEQSEWMPLTDLRAKFGTAISRDRIDQALTDLHTARKIVLIPESNQKILTAADLEAALWLGGEHRHLIATPTIR